MENKLEGFRYVILIDGDQSLCLKYMISLEYLFAAAVTPDNEE